jgi:hypothetical protein
MSLHVLDTDILSKHPHAAYPIEPQPTRANVYLCPGEWTGARDLDA